MTTMTSTKTSSPIKLRICDGEFEHVMTASVQAVERTFGAGVRIRSGTEISVTAHDRSLVAVSLGASAPAMHGQAEEFLLSWFSGEDVVLSGPVSRRAVLGRFRGFVSAPHHP